MPFYGKFDGDKAVKGLKNTSVPEDFADADVPENARGDNLKNAGNPFSKDDPDPGGDPQEKSYLTEEEEEQTIEFLASLGKTDDEIDKILNISRPPAARETRRNYRNESRKIIEDE